MYPRKASTKARLTKETMMVFDITPKTHGRVLRNTRKSGQRSPSGWWANSPRPFPGLKLLCQSVVSVNGSLLARPQTSQGLGSSNLSRRQDSTRRKSLEGFTHSTRTTIGLRGRSSAVCFGSGQGAKTNSTGGFIRRQEPNDILVGLIQRPQ